MESQEQSQFLSIPHEVRQAIYACLMPNAIHVFLRQGKIATSTCILPDTGEELTGEERNAPKDKTLWAQRLQSSWGPHWQCEEIAQGTAEDLADCKSDKSIVALLFVCKNM
jgi:hypothetical protein